MLGKIMKILGQYGQYFVPVPKSEAHYSALSLKYIIQTRVLERPERFSPLRAVERTPPRLSGSARVEDRGTGATATTTAGNAAAEVGYFC
jgi:hypothetical protein